MDNTENLNDSDKTDLIVRSHSVEGMKGYFVWHVIGRSWMRVEETANALMISAGVDEASFNAPRRITEGKYIGWFRSDGYTVDNKVRR